MQKLRVRARSAELHDRRWARCCRAATACARVRFYMCGLREASHTLRGLTGSAGPFNEILNFRGKIKEEVKN